MAFKLVSRLSALTLRLNSGPTAFSSLSSGCTLTVKHDRQKQLFTVAPGSAAGSHDECAVLRYRFTGEKEVDLMSTFVPETFRGQGVAAVLSQAAMDFVVEENLKAHVSCWYIKKYIEDNPLQRYKELVIS
ncbi:protein NATD1-like isoform X1 [Dicentrarchus labrax]|uniref:protein NATD1-like isoform X1 n=1 Tax=Dicentrarchus labrax TaxID=13489 RepID=UPI00163594AD|nr:protein NATD1-like isoform X1 [Dicentrarchus labrax]